MNERQSRSYKGRSPLRTALCGKKLFKVETVLSIFFVLCNDLKQECDRLGNPSLPPKPENKHIAIEDARWNKQVYEFLERLDFTERSKALRLG